MSKIMLLSVIIAFIYIRSSIAAYTINIFGPKYAVHGATNVVFGCILMSQRPEDIPVWYHNNRIIDFTSNSGYQTTTERKNSTIESKLYLDRASLDKSGGYKCQFDTDKVLDFKVVIFDSKNVVTMVNRPGRFGAYEKVKLECKVSAKTPVAQNVNFNWKFLNNTLIKNDSKKYLVDDNSLTILTPTILDSTNYMCYSPQRPEIKDVVIVEAPVRVKPISETGSISLVEGDTLKMKCDILANPPATLRWYRKRHNEDKFTELKPGSQSGSDKRVAFKRENLGDLLNSTLLIKDMAFADKGEYKCIASNGKTEHNSTVSIRIKDKLAALWPFLGICLEVLILCLIILFYEKRRAKKNAEKEARLDSSKNSTNYKSDEEDDPKIRHRKA